MKVQSTAGVTITLSKREIDALYDEFVNIGFGCFLPANIVLKVHPDKKWPTIAKLFKAICDESCA